MVISTKFNIGEEVYVIYKENNEIHIFKDKISEIVISKEKQLYYLEKHDCEEWQEDELVKAYYITDLTNKIEKLMEEKNEVE